MTLQGQLAQSQERRVFPYTAVEANFDFGLLGNKIVQAPRLLVIESFAKDIQRRRTVNPANVEDVESAEMNWLVENARELEQHKGEWLLIQGRELLVHSRDFAVLRATIQERQVRSPFVYYVPTDEESNPVTI
jgi:hypothetical protein